MRFEFDSGLQCWALRRYPDVQAALRNPQRFAFAALAEFDESAHTSSLRVAAEGLPKPAWIAALNEIPLASAPVELVSQWIEPWCHTAALQLVTLQRDPDSRLLTLARKAFAAGALVDAPAAENEALELAAILPSTLGSLTVQAFVAVSQTLTAFLANATAALLENNAIYPHTPLALEELLRYAGPSQSVFRYLRDPLGNLHRGTRIALMLADANRDPDQFPDPHRLNFERNPAGHLAFGYGLHACIGAILIRAAAPIALRHLTQILPATATIDWPAESRLIRSPLAIRIRERIRYEMRYEE